jgi:hypothetical protein
MYVFINFQIMCNWMYLFYDSSIDKSNVCISTKVNISTFKILYLCLKPLMVYYTSSLSRMIFFNFILNITIHIHKKKTIILYNTSNLHVNAPLPLLTWQKTFCLGRNLLNYVVLVVKIMFKYYKKNYSG